MRFVRIHYVIIDRLAYIRKITCVCLDNFVYAWVLEQHLPIPITFQEPPKEPTHWESAIIDTKYRVVLSEERLGSWDTVINLN